MIFHIGNYWREALLPSAIPLAAKAAAAPAVRVVHKLAIVDMAAVGEAAPVPESVARNNCMRAVHKGNRLAPSALIEITCGAHMVP
ncbi:MAG: hypothetical protein WBX25_24350 [Rhodomicrobium sp.]